MKKALFFVSVLCLLIAPITQVDANTCSPLNAQFYSDTSLSIEGGGFAVETYASPLWVSIPSAKWVWNSFYTITPNTTEEVVFVKDFTLGNSNLSGYITIASDDFFEIKLNNTLVASEFGEGNFLATKNFDLSPYLNSGSNSLKIRAINAKYFYDGEGTSLNNPGGVIFSVNAESQECVTSSSGGSGGGGSSGGPVPLPPTPPTNPNPTGGNTLPNISPSSDLPTSNAFSLASNPSSSIKKTNTVNQPQVEALQPESLLGLGTEEESLSLEDDSAIPLGALALSALGDFDWYCFLVALAIVLSLYIVSELTLKDESAKNKIIFLLAGAGLTALVLIFFDYLCPLFYLLALTIFLSVVLYFLGSKKK